jgi:uncharacterized UBP type Zn finger protein
MLRTLVASASAGFDNFRQQDAHEFFLEYLNLLHDEMFDSAKAKAERNGTTLDGSRLPTEHFDSELWKCLSCNKCGYTSPTTERFRDLSVDLPAQPSPSGPRTSLEEMMNLYFADEAMTWLCESCGNEAATQKRRVRRTPRVMALHVKRFLPDFVRNRYDKRHDDVQLPVVLDIGPYVLKREEEKDGEDGVTVLDTGPSRQEWIINRILQLEYPTGSSGSSVASASVPATASPHTPPSSPPAPCRYSLRAVVCHGGKTPQSGHYTTWVRHDPTERGAGSASWSFFDDSLVSVEPSRPGQPAPSLYLRAAGSGSSQKSSSSRIVLGDLTCLDLT